MSSKKDYTLRVRQLVRRSFYYHTIADLEFGLSSINMQHSLERDAKGNIVFEIQAKSPDVTINLKISPPVTREELLRFLQLFAHQVEMEFEEWYPVHKDTDE
ncbi:MAG: hypothetical protein K8F91_20565 [Candidatus Obscuribacterales bacterium]|nr:hypothetical protein [Candidatus Obscuribacterales bacterium]